jgi:PAS domain S-box-containing protein
MSVVSLAGAQPSASSCGRGRLDARVASVPLDDASEQVLADVARIAAAACRTPFSGVSVHAGGTIVGVHTGLCDRVVATGLPLLVEDCRSDPRLSGDERQGDTPLAGYLGVPILTPTGAAVGAVWVGSGAPLQPRAEDSETLEALARQVAEVVVRRSDPEPRHDLLERIPEAVMVFAAVREAGRLVDLRWTAANTAATTIVRRRAQELIGRRLLEEMPDCEVSGIFAHYAEVLEHGRPYAAHGVHGDHGGHGGCDTWLRIHAERWGDGLVVTFRGVSDELRATVTDEAAGAALRRAADQAAARRRLEQVLHEVAVGFISAPACDVDEQIVSALGSIGAFLGAHDGWLTVVDPDGRLATQHRWSTDDAAAPEPFDLSPDATPWFRSTLLAGREIHIEGSGDLPAVATAERALMDDGNVEAVLMVPLTEDGAVQAVVTFVKSNPGAWPASWERMLHELVEGCAHALQRRDLELELREAHTFLGHLIDSSRVIFFRGPPVGVAIDYVSPNVQALLGLSPEWVCANWAALLHPDDVPAVLDALRACERDGTARYEARYRHPDGRWTRWQTELLVVRDPDGEPIVRTGFAIDVTERRLAEEQLSRAQKLEAVGQLAGGVAHDFNNLLQVIHGNAELLGLRSDHREIGEIQLAAEQAQRLVEQLLTFSRQRAGRVGPVDINAAVEQLVGMLDRVVGPDVTIVRALAEEELLVTANLGQIEQMLVNLCLNARDAMPTGGTITVSTELTPTDEQERSAVRIIVADTGEGMTPEVLAQAFEPYFTTKPEGKGTGLGLATVYGAVTAAGGQIEVDSTPGAGTAVSILLPVTTEEPLDVPGAQEVPAPTARRVLVVEDQTQVRDLVTSALTRMGYHVLAAADGEEALAVMCTEVDVDLLVTDVTMPGLKGPEVAAALRREHPELQVLFMSGYTPEAHDWPAAEFLQKPFTLAELGERVQALLPL